MNKNITEIGFQYFSSQDYLTNQQLNSWLPSLRRIGASKIIFSAGFDFAIPEDVIQSVINNEMTPIVHFTTTLPEAQYFSEISYLIDLYAKWGVDSIIIGNKPNIRQSWEIGGWHHENLIDQFLERFIPLAQHSMSVGLQPVLAPLQPGGDFWDTAFMELTLEGLRGLHLMEIVNNLFLSSYGYTFEKSLSWGKGGPERWSISKPYSTPAGHEDQLGFYNFEWMQATSHKVARKNFPVLILDSGNSGKDKFENYLESVQKIISACRGSEGADNQQDVRLTLGETVGLCAFSLDTIKKSCESNLDISKVEEIFGYQSSPEQQNYQKDNSKRPISHYLLLPRHQSGVSDVVLNKVRPFIKKYQPTIGFSMEEASLANKVSIFPDPNVFTNDEINRLRSAGCVVQVLPESGIDIATSLQES